MSRQLQQTKKKEEYTGMDILTIQQVAQQTGKNEKTIRRWIQSGKLKAEKHEDRYLIYQKDLPALTKAVTPEWQAKKEQSDLHFRIIMLEAAVEELQYTVQEQAQLIEDLRRQRAQARPSSTTKRKKKKKVTRRWLPDHLLSLSRFADEHGITPSMVSKAIRDRRLFPEHGLWKEGWKTVRAALDDQGCQTFYELFHEHAKFKPCHDCPHKWW